MASMSMTSSSTTKPIDQSQENEEDRRRVSKACSRCRSRKDKCDGLKPCTSCKNAKATCAYEISTKKRGLPEGYVRGLERLTILACRTIDGLEDVLLQYLKEEEIQRCWNTVVGDELYAAWKESKVYQQLEEFLQSLTTTAKRKRNSESESPAESLDTIVDNLKLKKRCVADLSRSQQRISGGFESILARDLAVTQDILPSNSKELLDLYFAHVHCWFPVLDRPSVLKAYYGHAKKVPEIFDGGRAVLWAIFAYAVLLDATTADKQELSQRWSEQALKHIPTPYTNAEDVQDFDLMQAQALIVLSLLRLGNGQWLGAWMCTGRAVRILLAKKDNTKARKASLQGCFILETLLNVHFENGQPLVPTDLVTTMIDEDGYEEWESWGTSSAGPSFALSVFNRVTRVFIILDEALRAASASRDASFVRSKLTSIHSLAQEHFALGFGPPTIESPPHHVYFQIGLLFVQLRLVSRLDQQNSALFDLASLATNVLGLFEICEKSAFIGLTHVPPLFADILNLAIEVAAESRESFGLSPASPSYHNFVHTISDFRNRLSTVWQSFKNRRTDNDVDLATDVFSVEQIPLPSAIPADVGYPGINSEFEPLSMNAIHIIESDLQSPSIADTSSSARNAWTPQGQSSIANHPRSSFSNQNWGVTQNAQDFSSGFPVTSPSFAGDEVDAIFNEMAHLDTNEWTNQRATELRDFGFNDESAFMEFCNDPERLAMPNEGNVPLSSTRQSWTFATQPP